MISCCDVKKRIISVTNLYLIQNIIHKPFIVVYNMGKLNLVVFGRAQVITQQFNQFEKASLFTR